MKRIGIDNSFHDVYQNFGNFWRAVEPSPFISEAKLDPEFPVEFTASPGISVPVFREDSFDPVTRVRRGRFYMPTQGQSPSQQWALPHPVYGSNGSIVQLDNGLVERILFTYDQFQVTGGTPHPKLVVLGAPDSVWRVLGSERISTSEFLFTLKARHGIGILPEVNAAAIPESGRAKVIETLETLADAAHRESPGSVIDRARDAAQWCLATWAARELNNNELLGEDLGPLLKKIKAAPKREIAEKILLQAAEIIRVLHARVKPNEQRRRGLRPVMEDDSELALNAVGFLIREFCWVKG